MGGGGGGERAVGGWERLFICFVTESVHMISCTCGPGAVDQAAAPADHGPARGFPCILALLVGLYQN